MEAYERILKDGFRLLDLPVETRLRIYHLFFAIKYRSTDKAWVKVDAQTSRRLVKQDVWPLFQVCKKIYAEVMPEYYAMTTFHFNALVTLRGFMKSHKPFSAHVRHLVFNPNLVLPIADDLLKLKNLHTFAIANLTCHEPIGTPSGAALDHSTLRTALYREGSTPSERDRIQRAMSLYESVAELTDVHKNSVHLLLRFGYSYIEKIKHPDTWGGKSAKRYRVIEYDLTNDVFVILKPDHDENPIIRNPTQARE